MRANFRLPDEEAAHIQELEQSLIAMEGEVLAILETMPAEKRLVLEGFLYGLRELQGAQIQYAYRKGQQSARNW